MKYFIASTFAVVSLTGTIESFSPAIPAGSCRSLSRLHSATDKDSIKNAGSGITTLPPGDLCCYDPNEGGRLSGTNTLADRVKNGASSGSCRSLSQLHSATDKDSIKNAGSGITTLSPGDLCCYDPNEGGRLSGTNTLADRVKKGASFTVAATPPAPPAPEPTPAPTPPTLPAPPTPPTPRFEPQKNILTTANLRSLLNGVVKK